MKVLIIGSPKTLGGCAGLKRPVFHTYRLLCFDSVPDHQLWEGVVVQERPVTAKAFILKGLPPPLPWPLPGLLLGVDLCLPLPPPCPLSLFGLLPLNRLCLFCGLPGEDERPVELFLLPELLHC